MVMFAFDDGINDSKKRIIFNIFFRTYFQDFPNREKYFLIFAPSIVHLWTIFFHLPYSYLRTYWIFFSILTFMDFFYPSYSYFHGLFFFHLPYSYLRTYRIFCLNSYLCRLFFHPSYYKSP